MADHYTVRAVMAEIAESCGRKPLSDEQLATYFRDLAQFENAQVRAALSELKSKYTRTLPSSGQTAAVVRRQKFTLSPQKVRTVDILGNIVWAELTGSNRVRYCPTCKRARAGTVCYLCEAGVPTESLPNEPGPAFREAMEKGRKYVADLLAGTVTPMTRCRRLDPFLEPDPFEEA